MRPGPPVQPSRRRSPRHQHPRQQQLHRERDRKQQQEHHRPSHLLPRPRINGPRALLVLLLLASSPLVLGQAQESPPVQCQQAPTSHKNLWSGGNNTAVQQRNLTIGYLTAIKGGLKDRQGLTISGALSMALDEVRRDFFFAPGRFSSSYSSQIKCSELDERTNDVVDRYTTCILSEKKKESPLLFHVFSLYSCSYYVSFFR